MPITFTNTNPNTPIIDTNYLKSVQFDTILGGLEMNTNIQGCNLLNLSLFASLKLAIGSVNSCAELQKLVDKAMNDINGEIKTIEDQMKTLAEMVLLTIIPTDPMTWIIKYIITVLKPMFEPYVTYAAQLEQTIAQIAEVASAVEAAAAVIEGGCSINIPLAIGCLPLLAPGPSGNTIRTGIGGEIGIEPSGPPVSIADLPGQVTDTHVTNITPTSAEVDFNPPASGGPQ